MRRYILLLLVCASTQMQSMDYLKKLKTKMARKYYKEDTLWNEAFYIALTSYNWNNKYCYINLPGAYYLYNNRFRCSGDIGCVEEKLSHFYGKKVRFKRNIGEKFYYNEVSKVYEELKKGEE